MSRRNLSEDNSPGEELKKPLLERPRFPLVFKLFLFTAALIGIVIALAVGTTIRRSTTVANTAVRESISGASSLFKDLEETRLKELRLGVLTIARDVTFNAYVENALNPVAEEPGEAASEPAGTVPSTPPASSPAPAGDLAIDVTSIFDLLQERLPILGTDLLVVTNDQGVVITRSDRPASRNAVAEDMYLTQGLVKSAVDRTDSLDPVAGVILSGNQLYHAAVAPLSVGASNRRIGFLVNARAIDSRFAKQISRATRAEVLFLPAGGVSGQGESADSGNAPGAGTMQGLPAVAQVLRTGQMIVPQTVTIQNSLYVMTGEPLLASGKTLGAAVFVRSLDSELRPFRRIQQTLLMTGGIALLVAFILSWLMAKRLTRPIENLARMAQAATAGDYSLRPDVSQSDEVGILARSFAQMISALRDKAELEEMFQLMSERTEEHPTKRLPVAPREDEGTLLVTDLRGLPLPVGEGGAVDVIALVSKAMHLQETEMKRQDGTVLEIIGHRLVTAFPGEKGVVRAIRAARAISEELIMNMGEGVALRVGAGIASGSYVTGGIDLSGTSGRALVGNTPLLALLLGWEAPTDSAFIALEAAQVVGGELLASGTREEVRLRWLPAPVPVLSVALRNIGTVPVQAVDGKTLSHMATMQLSKETEPYAPEVSAAPVDLAPGQNFANRYRIDQVLGRGGMGVVYKATDTQLDEVLAIKTLPGIMLNKSSEELERFKREIRLARRITHSNVLRTYDYGEADGVYFISMEFVKGFTLDEVLREKGPMAPRLALGVARQICRGLQAAHEQTIVHRDIKPQNVLIDAKGEVKLMDFGIARMEEAPEAMTGQGMIIGTPHYMSPEQVQGKPLDARSDVYSMGVLLYEILCGKLPFDAPTLVAVLTAHITEAPKPPIDLRPEIGKDINAIVLRCLAKNPGQRFANAGGLLEALDGIPVMRAVAA